MKNVLRAGACILLLTGTALAHAGVAYIIERQLPTGDTIGLSGLADNGDVLLTGYGDLCAGGKSSIINRGGSSNGGFVAGLPVANIAQDIECGVSVAALNSAGDMRGSSLKNGTTPVSTIWLAGVAYDMTDVANALVTFTPDPGAMSVVGFDINSLTVLNAPAWFTADYRSGLSSFAWTNAKGEFALESRQFHTDGLLLVPVPVSAPSTPALVAAALAACAWVRRARQRKCPTASLLTVD